jgi:hypothetical protein
MEMRIAAWMYFGGWSHDMWNLDMIATGEMVKMFWWILIRGKRVAFYILALTDFKLKRIYWIILGILHEWGKQLGKDKTMLDGTANTPYDWLWPMHL